MSQRASTGTTAKMNIAEKRDAITDGFWSTAGTVLAGAATGAAIGAFFGPVGAAIGGIIGGLGAGLGLALGPSEEEVEAE